LFPIFNPTTFAPGATPLKSRTLLFLKLDSRKAAAKKTSTA